MPASITIAKAFETEPYRSILNLLSCFKEEGLTLKEIQYCIIENHYLDHVSSKMISKLNEVVYQLIKTGKINKYQIKTINRKNKIYLNINKKKLSNKAKKAEKIRNNIRGFLTKLEREIKVINKVGRKYKINKEFFNYGIKNLAIQNLNFWNNKDIQHIITEGSWGCNCKKNYGILPESLLLFGFSDEFLKGFNKDDVQLLEENLQNIKNNIKKIIELKNKNINKLWKERYDKFFVEINKKNKRLAKTLKSIENPQFKIFNELYSCYTDFVIESYYKNKILNEKISKDQWHECNLFFDELSQRRDKNDFAELWFEDIFGKNLKITFNDMKLVLDWALENIDFIYDNFKSLGVSLVYFNEWGKDKLMSKKKEMKI